ncbi:MAG TPA: sigma-70 family RNA polymerase sigma factor [Streptosporangiaceae bacterium]|jgi:RNA polymerase sigma-70 factor (ECF subfamily)
MDENEYLAERFEAHRGHLRSVAYRMLGSLSDADDAVQEAWLKVVRADTADVANLGGWLTTIVGRVCLDMLRSRTSRREEPLDARLPDPVVTRPDADPEHAALTADSVGLALLVVLESLAPAERLAFVLHDMFGVPFEEIAPVIGRNPAAARQLASRARRRVRGAAPAPDPDPGRQRAVVDAFLQAARFGEFDDLVAVLHPDVVLRADTGVAPGLLEVRGAENVARQARAFRSGGAEESRPALVNGAAGLVNLSGGRPVSVMSFLVVDGRVAEIDLLLDRARIGGLDLAFLDG